MYILSQNRLWGQGWESGGIIRTPTRSFLKKTFSLHYLANVKINLNFVPVTFFKYESLKK